MTVNQLIEISLNYDNVCDILIYLVQREVFGKRMK
jgi:hypothetical protein